MGKYCWTRGKRDDSKRDEVKSMAQGLKSLRENLEILPEFGGSPLLQRRGATLQRCGKELDFDYAL
jgi:hypothetical protein